MRCTLRWLTPAALAMARPVQCVASPSGSAKVISTTRSIVAAGSGGTREGRVASCSKPSTPSAMNRACQRQIVGLALPVCRWIAIVPTPSALNSTIRARHTCFCGLFLDPITASKPLAVARTKPDLDTFAHPTRIAYPRARWNHLSASFH
jgi:hypothetical protein